MGWGSGTPIFVTILETLQEFVPDDDTREQIIEPILEAFEDADWDNLDEAYGIDPVFDRIFDER